MKTGILKSFSILSTALAAIAFSAPASAAKVVAKTVATLEGSSLTTRDIEIGYWVRKSLKGSAVTAAEAENESLSTRSTNESLIEVLVEQEAIKFNLAQVSEDEVKAPLQKIKPLMTGSTRLAKLDVTEKEVVAAIRRQLAVQKFLNFKTETFRVYISDLEVQKYYIENPKKFSGTNLAQIRGSIRDFLEKDQLDARLASWFEGLKQKYKLKILK